MSRTVAIVTGAGGDIGRAIARALLDAGHAVLASDISADAARATAAALAPFGTIAAATADVTDEASVAAMAAAARALGPVAVLVNNAGGCIDVSVQQTGLANWRHDTALNLDAPMLCFKAVEADLKATRGAMVNIASVNGLGVYGHPAYSAAKAGMIHFTKFVAVEYGKFGIRANAVAPGTVQTGAWKARAEANPNVFEDAKRWYPLQRVARPEDVAAAVCFLAGAEAITGVVLPVDCGLSAGQVDLPRTFSQSPDF